MASHASGTVHVTRSLNGMAERRYACAGDPLFAALSRAVTALIAVLLISTSQLMTAESVQSGVALSIALVAIPQAGVHKRA